MDSRHFDLPDLVECVSFFDWERFFAPGRIQYLPQEPFNKKPPATASQGASFSRTAIGSRTREVDPQLLRSSAMMSPNSSHFSPLNRCIRSCLSGAKSVAEVLILTPGSRVSGAKSFRLAACFMTFSRVRLSPHISKTFTMVCAAP